MESNIYNLQLNSITNTGIILDDMAFDTAKKVKRWYILAYFGVVFRERGKLIYSNRYYRKLYFGRNMFWHVTTFLFYPLKYILPMN
jgi:hypothetical protein